MKTVSTQLVAVLLALLVAFGAGCVSEESQQDEVAEDSLANLQDDEMIYKIPTPIELYKFLKQNGAEYDAKILNKVERKEKYNTSSKKALNLGVYASDLAFSVVFDKTQETYHYFKVTKQLADELAFAEGYDETVMRRVENNLEDIDSLYEITADAYSQVCIYLENENKMELLSFVLVGSWIESVYISTQTVEEFSAEDPVVVRIVEQHLLLENLTEQLEAHNEDEQIQRILRKLKELQLVFANFYDESGNQKITATNYKKLEKEVKRLRSAFVY